MPTENNGESETQQEIVHLLYLLVVIKDYVSFLDGCHFDIDTSNDFNS